MPRSRQLDRLWDELYFVTGIWEKMLRGFVFFERSERNFLKHTDFDSFKEEDPELVKDETLARFKEIYLKRSNVKATGAELAKHPISIFFEDIRKGLKPAGRDTETSGSGIYLRDLQAFAEKAYRRPLTEPEQTEAARVLHRGLPRQGPRHRAAVRASHRPHPGVAALLLSLRRACRRATRSRHCPTWRWPRG